MSTYKVIQDIEAEDHILGPLSLRQFIYAIVAVVCLYFSYLVVAKHAAFLCVIFLPPAIFAGFFAFPFGKDQPTEVWALAKIRFLIKPRRRIWDQSGIKELVSITVPKKIEENRTDGLSQVEVKSRLNALASTIDSRGWAIKNVNVNMYSQPGLLPTGASSDRLIDVNSIPQEVPNYDVQAADDILDERANPVAQQFDQMIAASSQAHRQQIMNMMSQSAAAPQDTPVPSSTPAPALAGTPAAPANYWFLSQPVQTPKLRASDAVFARSSVVPPGVDDYQAPMVQAADPTAEEEALGEKLKAQHTQPMPSYAHMKTIMPLDQQQAAAPVAPTAPQPMTAAPDPAKIELARNNDLNVATIARIANKEDVPPEDNEVVISLH